MTHSPPAPRRWFQLRLTTLIAMMLSAGTLFYLNLNCCWSVEYPDLRVTHYGFPCSALTTQHYLNTTEATRRIDWEGVTVNVALAVAVVFLAAQLAEFIAKPAYSEC